MQVTATSVSPPTSRNAAGDAAALANARDQASRRADDSRADQARESQARLGDEAGTSARAAEPEAAASVAVGGKGELRGSRLDITV